MRVVLDSNILVSIIGKKSKLRPIWEALLNGKFNVYLSEDILKEYEEILKNTLRLELMELYWKSLPKVQMYTSNTFIMHGMRLRQIRTTTSFLMLPWLLMPTTS